MKALVFKDDFVTIETAQSEDGYIIKDKDNEAAGNIEIVEYSSKNRSCTFRMNLHENMESYEYITHIVKTFTNMLFGNANLFKVNILVKESLGLQALFDLNFQVEGFITNNRLNAYDKYDNEILLGTNFDTYKNSKKLNLFELKGKRIKLRILNVNDAEKVLNYYKRNEEHLRKFEELKDESFYTLKTQMLLIRQQYVQFLNGNFAFFGIFKDEKLIGVIRLYNIIWGIFRDATVGYSIDENEQGNGYMKEALNIISNCAFKVLKLHRLQATTLVDNIKSKAVLKACGFKEMGVSEKYLFINGKWQDQCVFYKLNEFHDKIDS